MFDPFASEFSLSASPTVDIDAMQALGRVLTDEVAPLREPAMVLISALLTGEEGPSLSGGERVSIKVISRTRSIRVEIRDSGTGIVLGGLRKQRGPASRDWSPHLLSKTADRWGLVSTAEGAWVWFELDLPRGISG
jgi:hypothetical protein